MTPCPIPETFTIEWVKSRYADGSLTPGELIAEIVRRAEADAPLNIWITPPREENIRPYLDRLENLDPESAPLWGIPFAVKDNIDVANIETTAACPDYAYLPDKNATVVERLIRAGAIPVGKTNLDQFATGLVGTRSPYGETHNALKDELISGGSSAGSAVAVARGHAAFALGTDTAGSGRVPAALNRLVGLKPSVGAWPIKGVVPACESLDCVTAFAGDLADAVAVDRVVRGFDDNDPWSKDIPIEAGPVKPSRILLPKDPLTFFGPYEEAYRRAWERTEALVEQSGVPVERVDIALFAEAAELLYEGPWIAERWAAVGGFATDRPESLFPVTERILRGGEKSGHDAASLFNAIHKLQRLKMEARKLLADGVLMMPTAGGTWTRDQVREAPLETNRAMGLYTNHCNLLDLCSIAVPAEDAAPDVPFGISLFALSGFERLLYETDDRIRKAASKPSTLVAVCGLHMRGLPLSGQMKAHGAVFVREDRTAAKYKLVKLPTQPAKPGLIKAADGGQSILLEVWRMPLERFGSFAASIPSPLGIGKVELEDGSEAPGFICEGYAEDGSEDITAYGGWRAATAQ